MSDVDPLSPEAAPEAPSVGERLRSALPETIRRNLTVKLLLLLLLGSTIGAGVLMASYTTVNNGLTAQVESQIDSDTTVQATIYENWLAERWSSLSSIAQSEQMDHESPSVLHQWLVAEQTSISPTVETLLVVDTDSGEILGSTDSSFQGSNLYERGLQPETTEQLLFLAQKPLTLEPSGEPLTMIGTQSGDRLLIAAVPSNLTLVDSAAYEGGSSGLYSVSGYRVLGNTEQETIPSALDPGIETTVTRADEAVIGSKTIAHDVLDATPSDRFDASTTVGSIVMTSTPKAEAFAFRQQILNTLVLAFALTFVILVGSAVVSMRSVTKEINRLSEKARRISEGVFDVDMQSARRDELGVLYLAIGEMRDSLKERIERERERKEAVEAARQEAERAQQELREVIDLVPDRIFARDRDGEYLLANEATAQGYGVTPSELEHRRIHEIESELDLVERFRAEDLQVIDNEEPLTIAENEVEMADGSTRIFQITKIPFDPPGREEKAVLGYARDVTELKEYEYQLEEQRNNLEVLNEMVRHDIRNNLQLVLAYAETLDSHVDEDGMEYLQQVLESARQAVAITESARDVAEIMLQSESELEPMSLNEFLEAEIENVRARFDDALIETAGSLPDVTITADEMLPSVFRNLLQNAVVHNDSEVAIVRIDVETSGDVALVRIADNGPGVPDDRKEEIFEEGDKGLDSGGTGLGLYLVRRMVDQYGGHVWVEDREGPFSLDTIAGAQSDRSGGAVFVVELPLAE